MIRKRFDLKQIQSKKYITVVKYVIVRGFTFKNSHLENKNSKI